ncbi:MAG: MoaF N-terminal domain [Thermoplasmata archaeon]|jgi:phenolic acid decarboxylase|nr:MoaF N-terminal domain [Thermoplasmata archaeon]
MASQRSAQPQTHAFAGKTLRWTFEDGPTAGTTFEHSFGADGGVAFRVAGKDGPWTKAKEFGVAQVAEDVWVVSYLAPESGYTLTVALNMREGTMAGFASDGKQWFQQTGAFDMVA